MAAPKGDKELFEYCPPVKEQNKSKGVFAGLFTTIRLRFVGLVRFYISLPLLMYMLN